MRHNILDMIKKAANNSKIEILFDSEIIEVLGKDKVSHVILRNNKTLKEEKKEASGVFFAVGHTPNTKFLEGQLKLDDLGYVLVKPGSNYTSVEGVFAAGDVINSRYKQAIIAAGSGCTAALDVAKYLEEKQA